MTKSKVIYKQKAQLHINTYHANKKLAVDLDSVNVSQGNIYLRDVNSVSELIYLIKRIPSHRSNISIEGNGDIALTDDELNQIIDAIPKHIKQIRTLNFSLLSFVNDETKKGDITLVEEENAKTRDNSDLQKWAEQLVVDKGIDVKTFITGSFPERKERAKQQNKLFSGIKSQDNLSIKVHSFDFDGSLFNLS